MFIQLYCLILCLQMSIAVDLRNMMCICNPRTARFLRCIWAELVSDSSLVFDSL